jgi:hypothetical protein
MGAWGVVVDAFQSAAVGLLLIALGWAAHERGRIHRDLPQLRRISGINLQGAQEQWHHRR